jgi:hypothetical protein
MKVDLKYPITKPDGSKVASVTLRRATVGDLKAAQRQADKPEDQELALIARLTGLVPEDVELIDLADYKRIQESFRELLDA